MVAIQKCFESIIVVWYTYKNMELDPHALYEIVQRIDRQMRCPQCGKRVPVDLAAVKVMGDNFLLLELKCRTCNAYIVLHASLAGVEQLMEKNKSVPGSNVSSQLHFSEQELSLLQQALRDSGGSFEQLFKKYGAETK